MTGCHCTEQNTLRSYSDFKNRKQGANGLAGRGSTHRDGTGPNGLRLCWGWRAASCRWEHRDCSLLAPFAKLFLFLIWTENFSDLSGCHEGLLVPGWLLLLLGVLGNQLQTQGCSGTCLILQNLVS